jgi:hypothetical protein
MVGNVLPVIMSLQSSIELHKVGVQHVFIEHVQLTGFKWRNTRGRGPIERPEAGVVQVRNKVRMNSMLRKTEGQRIKKH